MFTVKTGRVTLELKKEHFRNQLLFLIILIITFSFLASFAQEAKEYGKVESKNQRDARMAWWREAKFGMFIHWGLYAIPAGEWNGKIYGGISEWLMSHADIPRGTYERLALQFNPTEFDAAEWVQIAKSAGMKYIVITSKHHDGFALYDSQISDYDIIDRTPYKKDILRALSEECKKQDIRFCTYYSILDWHHPSQYPAYAKYYKELEEEKDDKPSISWDAYGNNKMKPDRKKEYITYMKTQLEEIVTQYNPAVIWFDGGWTEWWTPDDGKDIMDFLWSLNPDLIINNRAAGSEEMEMIMGDFGTPEQSIPGERGTRDWESCMTMNDSWGYKRSDPNWKPVSVLLINLIDIASKGGNFLLNVGPTDQGTIPEESISRLHEMGNWLKVNGEAIYDTHSWKVLKEGDTKVEHINSYEGDFEKYVEPVYTAQDILFTAKENTVYAICLAWPEKSVLIKSLAGTSESEINSVRMLGVKDALKWSISGDGLKVIPPDQKPCEYAYVFKISKN
jgi:alpha-L-fucosidase